VSPANWTQLVVVLATASLATALLSWRPTGRWVFVPFTVALLGAAAVVAAVAPTVAHGRVALTVLVAVAGALAVAGGGPLTARVFDVVDQRERSGATPETGSTGSTGSARSVTAAESVLRGGAWIGALERLAVFAGLAAGFPEGVAVVLALKGVGRFPDLKDDAGRGSATERFIIGTFTSVLWAAGCAGLVALVAR